MSRYLVVSLPDFRIPHRTINAYTARYGYSYRQQLFGTLLTVLKGDMPSVEPELVRGYLGSLEQI